MYHETPLSDTKSTRRCLPYLVAAAEHLRAVDHLAREAMPCEHLQILPPAGEAIEAINVFNVIAAQVADGVRFRSRCQCRLSANTQLLAAHELAFSFWDSAYREALYRFRRSPRDMRAHVERLRGHRVTFEQVVTAYRAGVGEAAAHATVPPLTSAHIPPRVPAIDPPPVPAAPAGKPASTYRDAAAPLFLSQDERSEPAWGYSPEHRRMALETIASSIPEEEEGAASYLSASVAFFGDAEVVQEAEVFQKAADYFRDHPALRVQAAHWTVFSGNDDDECYQLELSVVPAD